MKNVAIISLGCDKNRVDTEHMLYRLVRGGFAVSDAEDADIIIVNTCAFIESARAESIDAILECAELKKHGRCKKLIVTGCLPQKHRAEVESALPEVDAFMGVDEYENIVAVADDEAKGETARGYSEFCAAENCGRLLTTYPHVAYLKIAEGCDNRCTFCTIPSIRGGYRSRPKADIVREAEKLAADGVKELILVAQDVTRYGRDIGESLQDLLVELKSVPALVRLLYCYPECVSDELIDLIADTPNIVKYIDIPIQHRSDRILKLMNRHTTGESAEELINKLHARGIVVRTTLMTGFPSETEEEFGELCEFVRRARPEYAGVFAYSKEDGTPSAKLGGQISKAEKRRRVSVLGKACTQVTREFNKSLVGRTIPVRYENVDLDRGKFVGRARFMAPDVDGAVYFTGDGLDVGREYDVLITRSGNYDLFGRVVK